MPRDTEKRSAVVSAGTRIAYDDLPAAVQFLSEAFGLAERVEDRLADDADDKGGFTATWFELGDTTRMVGRAIPDAWAYATPAALLDARLSAMDTAMLRVLGDDVVRSANVARAAELAAAAVAECDMAGKPMGAANQGLPEPADPHLRLW